MANQLYRCAIYVRVSTEEQAENPDGSIRNQEERLRDFVKLKNHVAPFGEVTKVYSDPGVSAKDMNRPGFQNLLKAIERREVNLVLVTEISRLTRSMKDFGLLQEFLRKNNCEFLSLRENFDTSSATGGMVLNIMASIAEFERRQTAERISQSFLARAKRGLYNGGSVPMGYEVDPDKRGSLRIIPEEAEVVKLIFSTFLKKETMARTAKWLNDQKIEPPRRVRGGGSRRAKIFRFDMIHTVLRNPSYAGIRTYKVKEGAGQTTEQTKANWDAIVDQETFDRAQELLTKNRYRKRSHLNLRYPFTLSGVCYCQQCGHRMSGKSAHGKGGKIPYYEHSWDRAKQSVTRCPIPCEPARILAKKIEPAVWQDVKQFLTREEFLFDILESAKKTDPDHENSTELKRIESKCATLSRQIEVLAERLAKLPENLEPQALYSQMESLQKILKDSTALRDEKRMQSAPKDQPVDFASLQEFTKGFRALLSQGDSNPELQAVIIRKLVHRVEVTKDGYEIFFHVGQDYYERERRNEGMPQTPVAAHGGAINEKGGLAAARPPSKPLDRFFLDQCSKTLVSGGPRRDRTADPQIKSLYSLKAREIR